MALGETPVAIVTQLPSYTPDSGQKRIINLLDEHDDLDQAVLRLLAEQNESCRELVKREPNSLALMVREKPALIRLFEAPANLWREHVQVPLAIHRARALFKANSKKALTLPEHFALTSHKVSETGIFPLIGKMIFGDSNEIPKAA